MFSRWTVASVFMVTPLVVGCGAKTDTALDALPASASQQQLTAPNVDASPDSGRPFGQEVPGRQAPIHAPISDAIGGVDKPDAESLTEVDPDGDGSNEADRPRSLFRSIGRALQRGVTDAGGATSSESSNDASESVESEPTDPR